ncbi:VWA domain-containing protein [Gloeocapsa sp. PCC 73106]|uniref:VWA domain-containing protein n=1 Tax=Gloeocapsa sp. PCC 73106 TaxID=102232 RepID=UPI0002AC4928|nr:VWA domain-containing protein [Gloeocapsa sp. PCC 73106]ELS00024.1 hypothetical protein GLO73106DRAFT_00038770 [Gloeocapsa sp. PCC 73106]
MNSSCETQIIPSQQPLQPWQKNALNWVASLHGGRDVVIAIDLTESVGFNDGTTIRLRQIVEDSLQPNDTVYVVPFAATVNPLNSPESSIIFRGKAGEIETIIQAIPTESVLNLKNTDIQAAELYIYQKLAQINQCRLSQNLPVKPQSVVWITDAPLFTEAGITSEVWIETPAESPFRVRDSHLSQTRQAWLEVLPLKKRSLTLDSYQITVVDIPPTVQEYCTPAPGGRETCLVGPYLFNQLWLPTTALFIFLLGSILGLGFAVNYWRRLQKRWRLNIDFEGTNQEAQTNYLAHQQKITIGGEGFNAISCPGTEIRAYLERKNIQMYLTPTGLAPISYRGNEITTKQKISTNYFTINCPQNGKDFYINIKVTK